jgi:hypothetical protein
MVRRKMAFIQVEALSSSGETIRTLCKFMPLTRTNDEAPSQFGHFGPTGWTLEVLERDHGIPKGKSIFCIDGLA